MTLGNYTRTDGLRIRDIPEMRVENGEVVFDKIPTIVIVRPELSKAGHQYFTFLSEEGCEYLKDYLEERINGGEKITPNSPVMRPKVAPKTFIRTVNIGDIIREAIRGAGFTPEEVSKLDLKSLSDEEFQEIVRRRLLGEDGDDCIHMVLKLEEIDRYLRMGWQYVSSLLDGRVIVKKPC